MARSRNIKPGLFKNEVLGVADPIYTLCFQGTWLLADREGRLEDRPLRIKAEIFPYRDGVDINVILDWLHNEGFIQRYQANGRRYIQVLNFGKHQNPHKNETPSEIPAFEDIGSNTELIGTHSEKIGSTRADSLLLIPDSLNLCSEADASVVASKLTTCPQKEILALFAEELSELPQPRVWDGVREKNLRSRWRWVLADLKAKGKPCADADALDFFGRMFGYIRKSDFLMGRSSEWSCPGLHWIVEAGNFAKIIEGAYENKVAA